MNKQELIEKYEYLNHDCFRRVDTSEVLKDLKQLDEPEKPVVPQFVADVIEGVREKSLELEDALHYTWGKGTKEFTEWYKKKSNRDLFARAYLDGYEVEEEKRYEVILCNGQSLKTVYRQGEDRLDFEKEYGDLERFTRKQLEEAGFGWVFDCPGVQIEEVRL